MLKSRGRSTFFVAGKLVVIGAVGLCVLLTVRWYGDRVLRKFCGSPVVGLSRRAAAERAGKAGLRVSSGDKKDEVAGISSSIGLSWCVLSHDGTKVTSARFIRE